jgi:hypothetical protein
MSATCLISTFHLPKEWEGMSAEPDEEEQGWTEVHGKGAGELRKGAKGAVKGGKTGKAGQGGKGGKGAKAPPAAKGSAPGGGADGAGKAGGVGTGGLGGAGGADGSGAPEPGAVDTASAAILRRYEDQLTKAAKLGPPLAGQPPHLDQLAALGEWGAFEVQDVYDHEEPQLSREQRAGYSRNLINILRRSRGCRVPVEHPHALPVRELLRLLPGLNAESLWEVLFKNDRFLAAWHVPHGQSPDEDCQWWVMVREGPGHCGICQVQLRNHSPARGLTGPWSDRA